MRKAAVGRKEERTATIGGTNMENATHGMRLPTNYVDMSETDMQFDGGWSWKKFFVGVAIVGGIVALGGIGVAIGGLAAVNMAVFAGGMTALGAGGLVGTAGGIGYSLSTETGSE